MIDSEKRAQLASACLLVALSACANTPGSADSSSGAGGSLALSTGGQGEIGTSTSTNDQNGGSSSDSPVGTGGGPAIGGTTTAMNSTATGGTHGLASGGKRWAGGSAPRSTGGALGLGGTAARSTGGAVGFGGSALGSGGSTALSSSVVCDNPVFTESDKYGQYTFPDGSMVFNNIWGGDGGPQTIYACSPSNWYVISNQPVIANSRGEIKSYPCSKWDFAGKALDTFTTITSSFAATAPDEGVWNTTYDIWLGPGGWDIEVMLWTNYRYLATLPPGGAVASDSATIDGIEYYAWTYGSDYIGLAMKQQKAAGTLNFRHVFDWIVSKQWIPADAQLHAFEYGVEIAETNGKALTFAVTDFSVSGQ